MHALTFLAAATALISGTTASESYALPPGFKSLDCEAPYRELELEGLWTGTIMDKVHGNFTEEMANKPNGLTVAGGPKECLSLLGPIRREIGANAFVCNDNQNEIHLSRDALVAAFDAIRSNCYAEAIPATQIFHNDDWNLLVRGLDENGH